MLKKIFILLSLLAVCSMKQAYSYNPAHLRMLRNSRSAADWNAWRKAHPGIRLDLSGAVIYGYSFRNGRNYVIFKHINFRHAKIINCIFGRMICTKADFSHGLIKNKASDYTRPDVLYSLYDFVLFYKTKLIDSAFNIAKFKNANFNEAKIQKCKFISIKCENVSFVKAKIINSKFVGYFDYVDFSKAVIEKSVIVALGTPWYKISNSNFDNAQLIGCSLSGLLENVTFVNANLSGTRFYCKKGNADLTNANFTNANLTDVDFSKTTFKNVIFKNADMKGAKVNRKWYNYIKRQGVRNFDKIVWVVLPLPRVWFAPFS